MTNRRYECNNNLFKAGSSASAASEMFSIHTAIALLNTLTTFRFMFPTVLLSVAASPLLKRLAQPLINSDGSETIQRTLCLHGPPRTIVAFGDSLTSTSNGRWTDGRVWIEHVAEQLEVQNLEVYAWGGATSGAPYRGRNPSVDHQIEKFLQKTLPRLSPTKIAEMYPPDRTIYTICVGGNDYFQIAKQNGRPSQFKEYHKILGDVLAVPSRVVANIESAMTQLMESSARSKHFLVLNLPPLQSLPVMTQVHPALRAVIKQWVWFHNMRLHSSVRAFVEKHKSAGVSVTIIDAHKLVDDVLKRPEKYGIHDAENPMYGRGTKKGLFYDPIHPSGWAHEKLAEEVLKMLKGQEPDIPAYTVDSTTI